MMRRDLITVLQVGASFTFIFSAFNSQGFIEVAVLRKKAKTAPETGITERSGYYSLSIIYFFFTFFNFVIPSVVQKIGEKWSQVIGASGYLFFMLTFLYLNVYLLYFGSAVLGAGAALLWAGNGCYLVSVSRRSQIERNSGIMWAMIQSSLITGGFFLIFVLKKGDLADSFTLLYMVFSALTAIGIVMIICLPGNPSQYGSANEENENESLMSNDSNTIEEPPPLTLRQNFIRTLATLKTTKMMLFSVLFVFSGLEMTFFTGVYTSCLSATTPLKNLSELVIPYNALSIGVGEIIGGLHSIAFTLTYLILPFDSTITATDAPTYLTPTLTLTLLVSFLLGIADAFWQTQIYITIGKAFKNDAVTAFSLFKFFQSGSACVSFLYGSFLYLSTQLLILGIGCIASAIFFARLKRVLLDDETS
ncbi:unnamed protein product [Caenorhabditis sp. 36 PRJEB53466]|nr:unnamed protein product [Caenorhabditis sp. 36 PRJEB53466]